MTLWTTQCGHTYIYIFFLDETKSSEYSIFSRSFARRPSQFELLHFKTVARLSLFQQLLATIWYEGLPGWRRMNVLGQTIELFRLGLMFPIYCIAYMLCPSSDRGAFMRNPFVKFIAHSGSYMCFLVLLAAASQRVRKIKARYFLV